MRDLQTSNLSLVKPDALTQKQERFAQHYVAHGSVIEAYTFAYDVAPSTNRNSLRSTSYNVLNNPKVRARVAALQAAMTERTVMTTAELIADLEAIASADVNEIMSLSVGACRHCWGYGHRYQWRDDMEYARAVDDALAAHKPLPDMAGGFGYRADREPHSECSACDGAGTQRVRFTTTADLSPGARKLLKGIELFPDGSVKRVLLHDQLAARQELHRLKGLHIDRSVSLTAHVPAPAALKEMTTDDVLAYLERLKPLPTQQPEPVVIDAEVIDA
jgi:phage terminase small subunit